MSVGLLYKSHVTLFFDNFTSTSKNGILISLDSIVKLISLCKYSISESATGINVSKSVSSFISQVHNFQKL